jgi:hypothetical protein
VRLRRAVVHADSLERRKFFNSIPTSFALTDEQVNRLIAVGAEPVRGNPEFQCMAVITKSPAGPVSGTAGRCASLRPWRSG